MKSEQIVVLLKHHGFSGDSCSNLEPIKVRELAERARVSMSTASRFFVVEFQGRANYKRLCADRANLTEALKRLELDLEQTGYYRYLEHRAQIWDCLVKSGLDVKKLALSVLPLIESDYGGLQRFRQFVKWTSLTGREPWLRKGFSGD